MTADRLVQACVDALGVDGAALTAFGDRDEFVHLAVAGPATSRVAELQLTTGVGPCWEVNATHRPAYGPDLSTPAAQERWPGFAAAAVEQEVRAVFAFPVPAGAVCCGSLLLCRHRPGPLTAERLRDGLEFAETALWTLLDQRAGVPADQPADPLGADQTRIFQASGMIAAQLGTGVDDALLRLRAHAWPPTAPWPRPPQPSWPAGCGSTRHRADHGESAGRLPRRSRSSRSAVGSALWLRGALQWRGSRRSRDGPLSAQPCSAVDPEHGRAHGRAGPVAGR